MQSNKEQAEADEKQTVTVCYPCFDNNCQDCYRKNYPDSDCGCTHGEI